MQNVTISRKYIGICIYCRAIEDLTDEHIVPESLNGNMILEKASCRVCAKITGRFEGKFTGWTLRPARAVLGMKTKHKKKRPTEFPMSITRAGQTETQMMSVGDCLAFVILPQFGLPGVFPFPHPHYENDLKPGEIFFRVYSTRSQDEINELHIKYSADELSVEHEIAPIEFARMLAKIAYCMSVEVFGLNAIEEVYVLPAILGTANDIWQWVGCDGYKALDKQVIRGNSTHIIELQILKGVIFARIRLFREGNTPIYLVVVGRVSDRVRGMYHSMGKQFV